MLDIQIRDAVSDFVQTIQNAPEIQRYVHAQTEYSSNDELKQLRAQYSELMLGFQRKQAAGTYTQEDIDEVRELQMKVNGHRVTQDVMIAQEDMQEILRACNEQISTVLGMNFAKIAGMDCGCGGSCDC